MKRYSLALLLLIAFAVPQATAQTAANIAPVERKPSSNALAVKLTPAERKIAEGVTAEQLKDYLYFVASDEMEGRDTPSRGLDTTAKFIAMNLDRWGFKPAGDNGTFFQKIALRRDTIDLASTTVTSGGQPYVYGQDLIRVSENTLAATSIVYAGNGWLIKSKNLNPYTGLDIKGKLVAVFSEGSMNGRLPVPLPTGVTQADLTGTRGTDWADPVTYARANGAAGVVILPSKYVVDNWTALAQQFGRGRVVVDKFQTTAAPARNNQTPFAIVIASPRLANAIFTGEAGDPLTGYTQTFALAPAKTLSYSITTKPEQLWTQNVVAIWEGRDPLLKNEMVAIGAHYDHVGMNPNAPGPDKIWNGADDDGSGTVSVLSISEALSKATVRPKRSVLFVWHCGEEKGLWGS
jgi:hypothetical protein